MWEAGSAYKALLLIFQYEEIRRGDGDDFSQIYGMMQTAEQNARAYFLQCGNTILQPKDPDEATAEILYMFLTVGLVWMSRFPPA